jgi:SAM-dependent methyltransferase
VVTAFDLNADFVALTRKRVGERADVRQTDLANPLDFAGDGEFDAVVCPLVLHYLRDWQPALGEFRRILKPKGVLVFSTHHPFMDWKLFGTENYFAVELLEDEWEDVGKVRFYRRPLTVISQALDSAGFFIERLLEPLPTEDFRRVNPEGYERLTKNPWFLVVRAAKKD